MKRSILRYIFTLIVIGLIVSVSRQSIKAQTNLLQNPGFESPFVNQGSNTNIATGWNGWFIPAAADAPNFENTRPEYYEAVRSDRIHTGSNAQRYESFFATHDGGVFQVVSGVGANREVTFSAFAYVWSSGLDDENVSAEDGDVIVQVGIDPTGGTDGSSDDIIWSVGQEKYDAYNQYSISAISESDTVSVWVRSRVGFPQKTSRVYVDDAVLNAVGEDTSTDEPTITVSPTTVQPTVATSPQATSASSTVVPPSPTVDNINVPTSTPVPTTTNTNGGGVDPIGNDFPSTLTHTVQSGDTLSRLAARYNSAIQAIQQANGLGQNTLIFVGQGLVIPVRANSPDLPATNTPVAVITITPVPAQSNVYVVIPGDTLTIVARRFNTTVAALAQLNGIVNPNSILVGQRLNVLPIGGPIVVATSPPPVSQSATQPVIIPATDYIVQQGDTLYRISLRFNTSLSDLIRINNIIDSNRIFTGQRLIIR